MSTVPYRQKPVVIEAAQWTGVVNDYRDWVWCQDAEAGGWCIAEDPVASRWSVFNKLHDVWIAVEPGDWIIKGVLGEFYPCKPDVFAATYDPV